MAGHGPAPKDPGQRRRQNAPARGDWVDLPPLTEPVLPELPKRRRGTGKWHPRVVAAWDAWRQDPATTQYGPAEVAAAVELAWVMDEMAHGGPVTLITAVQRRMDALGLTAKGKRDLRWRPPAELIDHAEPEPAGKPAEVRRLRAV